MERLTMCRICLTTNVRMHNLVDTYLQEIYEDLTAIQLATKDNRPVAVCYICCARLRNCYQLRVRCLQSEKFLAKIMTSNGLEQPNQDASIINTLTITPVLHLSMGEDVVQNSLLQPVIVQLKRESPETEVIVKKEDPEDAENEFLQECYITTLENNKQPINPEDLLQDTDAENEFLQEYYITTLEDNKQPINPEDLLQDTANAQSQSIITRLKFEDSAPTPQEARRNFEKNKTISFSSHAENEILNVKKNCQVRNSVSKSYKCDVCGKSYRKNFYFVNHNCKRTVHRYKCEICGKLLSCNRSLREHSRTVHDTNKPYKCNNCHKTYLSKNKLNLHLRVHNYSTKIRYKCEICNKSYTDQQKLHRHMVFTHIRNSDKQKNKNNWQLFTCEICNKDFPYKGNLILHMRMHTGEKPYQCDVCKKSFSGRGTLTKHFVVHSVEKPFTCDKCDKGFKRKCNLDIHTLTHSGDRQYTCAVCNKSFLRKNSLIGHIRIHTGEKPFPCEICKENFRQKSTMKSHMRRVHKTNLVG